MKTNDQERGNPDLSNITPAKITLTKDNATTPADHGIHNSSPSIRKWTVPLIILVVVAGAVFFILPSHIATPELKLTGTDNSSQSESSSSSRPPTAQKPESSPFQEAQDARQRSKSQEILSEILRIQEELENKNVILWGEERYNNALGKATQGDEAYRSRNFIESSNLYGSALIELQSLLTDMDTIYSDAISRGYQAINDGFSDKAQEEFGFALLIQPGDENASKGLKRAESLDQVLQLLTEGNDLQQNNQLEAAREKYQQVLNLDPATESAKQQISNVNRKINDRDFNELMSAGYRSLQQNNLEAARLSFQKAKRLKPNAPEVISALDQTNTGITNVQINQHLAQAIEFEQQEKWGEAVEEYNKALVLDANLAQAQEGKAYSDSREKLDNRLNQIIAEPERLSNKAVFEETRIIMQQASGIPSPEPRLSQQLTTISGLLNTANNPVNVIFMSDNQTNVRLNRIGELGKFDQTSLTLLPGNYIATGTREGFRDVRIEFNVPSNQQIQPVTIIASERIVSR
jgi:hypothetical protein